MTALPANPSGADLVAAIEAEAARRDVSRHSLASVLATHAETFIGQLAVARKPKPHTVARVAALIAGGPLPPKPSQTSGPAIPHDREQGVTGEQLIAELRHEAERRGVTLHKLVGRMDRFPARFIDQLAVARRPRSQTVDRVRAIIADQPLPETSKSRDLAARIADEATATGRRRADARSIQTVSRGSRLTNPGREPELPPGFVRFDREPCFRCGVRGDLGCVHRPLEMRA